jgi:hypothetical protein
MVLLVKNVGKSIILKWRLKKTFAKSVIIKENNSSLKSFY